MTSFDKDETIAALKKEISTLRSIIALLPGNFFWKDTEGYYRGCNNNVAALLKLDHPNDIIGKHDTDLIARSELVSRNDQEVLDTKKEISIEESHVSHGETLFYLSKKKPILDENGDIQGLLGISVDITERKLMEKNLLIAKQKAETADRAKSRFLAMISHELRTPLSSILGLARLIEKTSEADKQQDYLRHVIHSGDYLLNLVNALLDYNKLETNKYEIVSAPVNLRKLIQEAVEMLKPAAIAKHLPIHIDYPEDVPTDIMSSNRPLRQIIINLLSNAIKFTHSGQIDVKVELLKTFSNHYRLKLSVTDTGIGIPVREQKSIFKRFYQLGNVFTRDASLSGTGLGLAIVKKLAKLLGGTITVTSQPLQGSTFSFSAKFMKLPNSPLLSIPNLKTLVIADPLNKLIPKYLSNALYDLLSMQEALELQEKPTHWVYDIVLMQDHDNNILLEKFLRHPTHPLCLVLTTQANDSNNAWKISENPTKEDIKIFQQQLKTTWENHIVTPKKPPLTIKSKPYVLLVEDNELIQIIHKRILLDLGCRVDIAACVPNALELLPNNYDMLFVDIGLPDVTGLKLIETVRAPESAYQNMPIIVLTGFSEEEESDYCRKLGANEVCVKPVMEETFKQVLQKHLRREESCKVPAV